MKWLFFLLLLANLALFSYMQLAKEENPDARLMSMQMNADKIKIVPAQQASSVAQASAPQAAKVAAVPAACMEWSGFTNPAEAARATEALAKLKLGNKLTQREATATVGYWVYIPPLKSKADAEKKMSELDKLGVEEYYLVQDNAEWRFAISLGVFKTEDAARAFHAKMQEKGVRSARMGAHTSQIRQTVFVVREPDDSMTASLTELKQSFPGSELKAAECAAAEKK
jgi:cell division septation protein DedD